ncbi:MAG: thioredoxin TrxC [Cocleimonas sp.]|nr:thioredoxin TrxC [Cocleimonas sp.]
MTDKKHILCPHCDVTNCIPAGRLEDHPKCGRCKQPLFTGEPINLTISNFAKHIRSSDIPVVVDFWAPWCAPCQTMAPAFSQAAQDLEPYYRLVKVDTEAEQTLGGQYNIRSIPTLMLFKDGQELARQPGAMGASDIVHWVKRQD